MMVLFGKKLPVLITIRVLLPPLFLSILSMLIGLSNGCQQSREELLDLPSSVLDVENGNTKGIYRSYPQISEKHKEMNRDDQHQQKFEFARSIIGSLSEKDVLEVGCGHGGFIRLFLNTDIASYTYWDFNMSQNKMAQLYSKDPRMRLIRMESTQFGVEESFDLVVVYDAIEHIPVYDIGVYWTKIRRALRPGGYVVICTPIFNNPNAADHNADISTFSGRPLNKQTWGTLVRACLRQNFTVARAADEGMLALVRSEDLPLFDQKRREAYLAAQSTLLARYGVTDFSGKLTPAIERTLVPGAGRVAMGCVAEDNVESLSQTLRLLQSVRWFGGCMAGVNFFVCAVNSLDPKYAQEFERLGAFVRIVSPFSSRHSPSNKLRLLDLSETRAYDMTILIDCDTIIVQDPWPFLDGETFQAKLDESPEVPYGVFQRLFDHFGLELPEQSYPQYPCGAPTVWCCDTGVLVFPRQTLLTLGAAWRRYNAALLDRLDLLGSYDLFCEQASLSLAYAAQQTPFRGLPLRMNFPLHILTAEPAVKNCDPIILRYKDRVDASGYLQTSPNPRAQKRIRQFNERLRQERRRHFDNRLFWDFRYTRDPKLGSGLGSRADVMVFKQEMLSHLVTAQQPQSILDIGCGDQAVSQILPDDIYTGVDISPVVIERNMADYPGRQFICGDVLDLDLNKADLVICLDVLIHIDNAESYQAIVTRLVELTNGVGLVSGYEEPPDIEHSITFYHEPLSKTLTRAGARNLKKIGAYHNVSVWTFEPPDAKLASLAADF